MKTMLQSYWHVVAGCAVLACLAGCGDLSSVSIVNRIEKKTLYNFRVVSAPYLVILSPSGAPYPTTDQIEVRALRSVLLGAYSVCPFYDPQWSLEYDDDVLLVAPVGSSGPAQSFQVSLSAIDPPRRDVSTILSRGYATRHIRITARTPDNDDYSQGQRSATVTVLVLYDPSKQTRRDIADP